MNQSLYPSLSEMVPCVNGRAELVPGSETHTYRCNNVDLYSFKSHRDLGSKMGFGSSSWGWTSADGREFVMIGQKDGAAFGEITPAGRLNYLGRLPAYSKPSEWREIRVFKNYAIIGSEAEGHGIQVFDLNKVWPISMFLMSSKINSMVSYSLLTRKPPLCSLRRISPAILMVSRLVRATML
jgi:hypothetical protein